MLNIHKVFFTHLHGNVCLFSTVMFIGSSVVLEALNSSIFFCRAEHVELYKRIVVGIFIVNVVG